MKPQTILKKDAIYLKSYINLSDCSTQVGKIQKVWTIFCITSLLFACFLSLKKLFTCVGVLLLCIYVHHTCTVPTDSEEGGFPGTGVTHGCKPLCGCWELNLGILQQQ